MSVTTQTEFVTSATEVQFLALYVSQQDYGFSPICKQQIGLFQDYFNHFSFPSICVVLC